MATKNLKLTIVRPGVEGLSDEIAFTSVVAKEDVLRIPYRYPFADISNYTELKNDGYFRHATTGVSTELGGSAVSDTEGKLGFQLPITEKLVLLVKRTGVASTGTPKQEFALKGSTYYKQPDTVVSFAAEATFTSGVKIYELDLYNYGLHISGISGEQGLSIVVNDDVNLEFALVARMA